MRTTRLFIYLFMLRVWLLLNSIMVFGSVMLGREWIKFGSFLRNVYPMVMAVRTEPFPNPQPPHRPVDDQTIQNHERFPLTHSHKPAHCILTLAFAKFQMDSHQFFTAHTTSQDNSVRCVRRRTMGSSKTTATTRKHPLNVQ